MGKFALIIVTFMTATLAIELPCRYNIKTGWWPIDDLYFCDLINDLNVSNVNTQITSVTGEHVDQKSNANVIGFQADHKTMQYLPRGLEKYFVAEKIEFIEIRSTGLQEVHQIDLKPFAKMRFFSAWQNNLRVLERDLFKFNPEIEMIFLGRNQIKFIDWKIFQDLVHLKTVYLDGNVCIGEFVNADEHDDYKIRLLSLANSIRRKCRA